MNTNMKWLWLEDEKFSVSDIETYLKINRIEIELFSNLDAFYKKLIFLKRQELLNNYGLVLDVKLDGVKLIPIPEEWSDVPLRFISVRKELNNGGILFFKHAIVEAAFKFWNPPPPVIFLSTVPLLEYIDQINEIKAICGLDRINYTRKWDYRKELLDQFKKW